MAEKSTNENGEKKSNVNVDDVVGTTTSSLSSGDEKEEDAESPEAGDASGQLKGVKDKTCLVCGDKALGYNFNAITCESCKAFFRRNAHKEIKGRCEGKCVINMELRSYCKKCRLAKCVSVGMKRDLILTDKQKKIRYKKIVENRYKRMGMPVPDDEPEPEPESTTSSPASSTSREEAPNPAQLGVQNVDHTFTKTLSDSCLLGLAENTQAKLREVISAFRVSFDGPMEHQPVTPASSTQFLNMADTSVKRLVKMAKHIHAFMKIEQQDQITLLKGAIVEVLILRSAKIFDTQSQGWNVEKNGVKHTVSADALRGNRSGAISFFEQYQQFSMALLRTTHSDNIVIMLLIVLAVLSPDRVNLHARDIITTAQEEYAFILNEYVTSRYPQDETMFARVLQKLTDIREMNETHAQMLMHMKVDELEPLIVEIFDMA